MRLRYATIAAISIVCGLAGVAAPAMAQAGKNTGEPAIGAKAEAAIGQMAKSLSQRDFSFRVRTIRVYWDSNEEPLHIFHSIEAVVHRPDRIAVHVTGDDGKRELLYDGKTVALVGITGGDYTLIRAPGDIDGMLKEVIDRLHIDFPLADLLTGDPNKAFLSGVVYGRQVNTVTIDGKVYRHLFLTDRDGADLELWLADSPQALPRRLIVTYDSLPDKPSFIAEFSDWNFSVRPSDAEFVFKPPAGAKEITLKPAESTTSPQGGK